MNLEWDAIYANKKHSLNFQILMNGTLSTALSAFIPLTAIFFPSHLL